MREDYRKAFVDSVEEVFSTMLMETVSAGEVTAKHAEGGTGEITGIIGLSGDLRGTVTLYLPIPTALAVVSRLLGMDVEEDDESVGDAVAEMVNMMVGSAKARIPMESETPIVLSLPTIVRGSAYNVVYPGGVETFEIPFSSSIGDFRLHIALEQK